MMYRILYFVSISLVMSLFSCKGSESEKNTSSQTAENFKDPLVVPTPEGYYEPKGLKKLNLMEMYNLGSSGQMTKDFPLKDEHGNDVSWDIMNNSNQQLFMQIYADANGKPAEGVVYKITDEIKMMIMKVRIVSQPPPVKVEVEKE